MPTPGAASLSPKGAVKQLSNSCQTAMSTPTGEGPPTNPATVSLHSNKGQHRPPMNIVVIKGSPSLDTSSPASGFASQGSPGVWSEDSTPARRTNFTTSNSFSPFKLRPRGSSSTICTTTSITGSLASGIRGQKRSAISMSAPFQLPEQPSDTPPRPITHSRVAESSKSDEGSSTSWSSPVQTSLPSDRHEIDQLGIQGLSLQSPIKMAPSFDSRSAGSSLVGNQQNRSGSSSFSVYHSTSPRSFARGGSTASSAVHGQTPSSSARSSPRHVPLTVLSGGRPNGSPSKSVSALPPLHLGGPSMLYSLDGGNGGDDENGSASPRRVGVSCNSSISSSCSAEEGGLPFAIEPLSPPSTTAYRRPLPKVNLTPKTPSSCGSHKTGGLPLFPAQLEDDVFFSSTPDTKQDSQTEAAGDAMDRLLHGFANACKDDGRSARLSSDLQDITDSTNPSKFLHPSSSCSLALSADGEANNGSSKNAVSRAWLQTESPNGVATCMTRNTNTGVPTDGVGNRPPGFATNTNSLLQPSHSSGILKAMFQEETLLGTVDPEREELSDIDDEEGFVLSCPVKKDQLRELVSPSSQSDASDTNQRAKQRRRRSDEYAIGLDLYNHASSTSLASGLASNTSLFGMDIVHEDGQLKSVSRPSTPHLALGIKTKMSRSGSGLNRRDSEELLNSSSGFLRKKSEHSLGSLGLCLDGSMDDGCSGRELETPPITSTNGKLSPPPLPARPGKCIPY